MNGKKSTYFPPSIIIETISLIRRTSGSQVADTSIAAIVCVVNMNSVEKRKIHSHQKDIS